MKKINITTLLMIVCSLSLFSQSNKSTEEYEKIILDGKIAYINSVSGEIVSNHPDQPITTIPTTTYISSKPTALSIDNSSRFHTVKQGETFYSISRAYGISVNKLKQLNPSINISAIKVNQEIIINNNTLNTDYTSTSNKYVVKKGDTLYSISKEFNMSLSDLKQINNLNSNLISVGQSLIIR